MVVALLPLAECEVVTGLAPVIRGPGRCKRRGPRFSVVVAQRTPPIQPEQLGVTGQGFVPPHERLIRRRETLEQVNQPARGLDALRRRGEEPIELFLGARPAAKRGDLAAVPPLLSTVAAVARESRLRIELGAAEFADQPGHGRNVQRSGAGRASYVPDSLGAVPAPGPSACRSPWPGHQRDAHGDSSPPRRTAQPKPVMARTRCLSNQATRR